jgi:hypothetical protein
LDTIGGDYNCIVIEFAENKTEAYIEWRWCL